ncbi:DNA/RNA non-specific endonuclease [Noviherbaspirillum malthae]|jgi:endonuclease G|uniref:DNA/RNA non-specific endonuclease n=1 Tax=Noviherbaspirillum malthae TaxID=1260987 RepID=UPI00188EB977|nr:DNA/RNA non-specific endonuclease [Noviherbaspirillum malthae]
MVSLDVENRIKDLVKNTALERKNVRDLVRKGQWRKAEPDADRMARFTQRKVQKMLPPGAESTVGKSIDLQSAIFLTKGVKVRRAIAYVEAIGPRVSKTGSGFMISPTLFMTCRHVIPDVDTARGTQITFDRELDETGRPRAMTTYLLDPDRFALFSPENDLDYALIAVGERNAGNADLAEFGFTPISMSPDRHVIGMNVNIIQHPNGLPKLIAVRNNLLTYRTNNTLLYETDTDEGSSGAAVYNDDWEVVALHHWGEPYRAKVDENGSVIPLVNEGIRISAIYQDLELRSGDLDAEKKSILLQTLHYAKVTANNNSSGRRLSPPRHSTNTQAGPEAVIIPSNSGGVVSNQTSSNELRFTIPVEISVRLGNGTPTSASAALASANDGEKALTRGPEAVRIDTNYDNRVGYVSDFIPGAVIPLPTLDRSLVSQLAPLRAQEANAEEGELLYEHFSIKVNKNKRMAIFTATNVDGEAYLAVDRKTGRVHGPEGETWFRDPRISGSFVLDQTFYSAWSTYFDRGHLTRRTDPTWGSPAEAERANADTFHFSNCTPQHFRFNQTTPYWQGAERYILEHGVLAEETNKRICVFQGPIFNDAIDLWSDDVQIPSSFFKIVVWMGATKLKAVGLVVDQLQLLSEARRNLGQPRDSSEIDVNQWRVAISQIEQRTGLDFGEDVRNADTFSQEGQPAVGEEGAVKIRKLEDILG